MKDFFISYNRHDKQWAEWIAWTLEEAGYSVVVEVWDFRPGENFVLCMNTGVTETQHTIAVLSEYFLQAVYTHPEWAAAFAQDPRSLERKLIPIRVGVCQPKGLLAQIVYVDLVGVTAVEAKAFVLDALRERAKPVKEPMFPGVQLAAERIEPEPVAFPMTLTRVLPKLTASASQFDVIMTSDQGREINRKPEQAISFTESLGNGIELEMVAIPGGQFQMGTLDYGEEDERPQHRVTVEPFLMGKYPVTQAQWQVIADLPKLNQELNPNPSRFKGNNRPVEQVTWYDAVEFCNRLSAHTGRAYCLPSEAKWEYACRAGTITQFYFGEMITSELANYDSNYTHGGGAKSTFRNQTTDVGQFPPNAFGLYDLHGNVWEWCLDHWHETYKGAPSDGCAWIEGGNASRRLLRGGSYFCNPRYCRSAYRRFTSLNYSNYDIGFRVVCSTSRTLDLPETTKDLDYRDIDRALEKIVGVPESAIKVEKTPLLQLEPKQRKDLRAALIAAFPGQPQLELMAEDELGESLNRITQGQPNYELVVRDLVQWAEANGRVRLLLECALQANPGNPKLQKLANSWLQL